MGCEGIYSCFPCLRPLYLSGFVQAFPIFFDYLPHPISCVSPVLLPAEGTHFSLQLRREGEMGLGHEDLLACIFTIDVLDFVLEMV